MEVPKEIVSAELLKPRYCSPYFSIQYEYDRTQPYTHGGFALFYKDFGGKKKYPKENELVLLGFADDEEVAKGIVEKVMGGQHYQNYSYVKLTDRWVRTAVESLSSLLKANGIFTENPAPKCGCYGPSDKGACDGCDEWCERESKLYQKRLILEVKK